MEFKDVNDVIYSTLYEEYSSRDNFYNSSWNEFLLNYDIGIQDVATGLQYVGSSNYTIIDEKKWLMAKLKYGI